MVWQQIFMYYLFYVVDERTVLFNLPDNKELVS